MLLTVLQTTREASVLRGGCGVTVRLVDVTSCIRGGSLWWSKV
jgi:hypothetical protein